ncbi:hypothetical protein FACS1894211_12390 [Clostridia bacterium]|nr:hypothetical protein FACS1894211_12390 [Clostridia bacterium]
MFIYCMGVFLLSLPLWILWPLKVIDKKNLPKRGKGAIVCCNHHRFFDPMLIGVHSPRRLYFVAKKELMRRPLIRFVIWSTGSVSVDRGKTDLKALKRMLQLLKAGKPLLMFPEGHRNKDGENGELLALQHGAVMLAVKARVPIVPAAMLKRPRLFRRNYLVYGESIEFSELYGEILTKERLDGATQRLAERMEALKHTEVGQKVKNKN